MKLTECKSVLAELGIRPTKSLGQNFLIDSNILDIIVRTAKLSGDDVVLEIGPGLGALTERLIERAGKIIAVEKDARLHDWLKQRFGFANNLQLLCADALEVALPSSLQDERFKVVANLPYSISSALLERFVENTPRPLKMVLTLQREMAARLAAKPATKDYGALTIYTQLYYSAQIAHVISPSCFYPAPEVESAVIVLDRLEPCEELASDAPFKKIVRAAFTQRRKMLRKMLVQSDFAAARVDAAFGKLKIAATVRGEELSRDQFVQLANELM